TDLLVRAEASLGRAEMDGPLPDSGQAIAESGPRQKSEPQVIREATQEEIRTGLGAMYTRQATTFRVFAPTAKAVSVVLYDDSADDGGRILAPMRQQGGNLWEITIQGDLNGKFYTLLLDENDPKRKHEVL